MIFLFFRQFAPLQVLAYLLLFTTYSCEKVVTGDLNISNSAPRLVIEGGIERNPFRLGTVQRLRLISTIPYLSKEQPPAVTNALVNVSDGAQNWVFLHTTDGWYECTNMLPELGQTYTLRIEWEGDMYEGSSEMNPVPPIDTMYYAYEQATSITDEGYFVRLNLSDPAGVANYYYYRVLVNDTLFILPDRGNNRTLILSDAFFDGQTSTGINPNEEVRIKLGDTVTVQQLGINKGYFDYLYNLFTQTGNQGLSVVGNPPPAPIRSNVINISRPSLYPAGYFYTTDVFEKTVVIE